MELPKGITVTRVEGARLPGTRGRVVGCNARKGTHGRYSHDPVVRLHTDAGTTAWGGSWAGAEQGRQFVGRMLEDVFSLEDGTADTWRNFDFALWDLAGRLLRQPVYALLGGAGCHPVPVYDGSIYIDDVDPETRADRGIEPVLEGVRAGLAAGFRGFKVKIGRGCQWMEKEAGLGRDVEVLHAIRALIGPEAKLLVDANNGYTPDEARELMRRAGVLGIHWFEEPFPEERDACLAFKRFLCDGGWDTLLADGEGAEGRAEEVVAIARAGGVDVVQLDMRGYGLSRWRRLLPALLEKGIRTAPHNWGSHLARFYIAHFARGCPGFALGETDPMAMPAVLAPGYRMVEGVFHVPDAPGFGLELDEDLFTAAVKGEHGWVVD